MTKRRSYDDEFRASAVLMLEAAGYPGTPGALQRVADQLSRPGEKMHARTLSRWFHAEQNPPPDKMVSDKKRDFVEQLLAIRGLAAEKIEERIDEYEPRELTGLLKISSELAELLQGKPTRRIETVENWLRELPQDEYDAVIAEAEDIVARAGISLEYVASSSADWAESDTATLDD